MTDKEELESFFLNEKPAKVIAFLKRMESSYTSEISDNIGATYAHTAKIMYRMEDHKLVESERISRRNVYTLTEKGKEIAENFLNLFEAMSKHQETGKTALNP